MESNLTPLSFDEFIGQSSIVENLKVYIEAALMQNRMIDHILFLGSSGLGKSTLSNIIATQFGVSLKVINAPTVENSAQLAHIFSSINPGDIILLDEIHALNPKCEEFLYPILQEYRLDFIVQYAQHSKVINLDLPPFTLIAATTKPFQISQPLMNRFPIQFTLQPYTLEQIKNIIKRNSSILGLTIDEDALDIIAYISRLTPRKINGHLKRLLDYQCVYKIHSISKTFLKTYLNNQGLTPQGLNYMDCKYLRYLDNESSAKGLASIALSLNIEQSVIVDQIEPYLLRMQYIELTKNGRRITKLGLLTKDDWIDLVL